jgi:hypothetical protein
MTEQENLSNELLENSWYVEYNDHRKGSERGPYSSKLDALIGCFPEITIREGLKKTEIIEEDSSSMNKFKDLTIFPFNIVPRKRLYETYT